MPATPAPVSLEPYAQAQPPPSGFIDPQSFQPGSVPAYPSERAPVAPPQLAADSFRGQPDPLSQSGARPARPYQLYAALVIAVVAVAGLVGYATYLLLSDRAPTASTDARLPDELEATLLRGTPTDLAKADTELRKLEATPTVAVALGRLRHRALAGLEVTGVAAPIDEAVAAARKQGASSEDTAFGELASAVLAGDRARADAVVTANPDARDKSAMFALFEGALLELAGDPAAAARYEKALELDARLIVARVRLARLLLLRAEIEAGEAQLALVPEDHPARAALSALAWARNSLAGKSSPAPKLNSTSADLPRCLHPVFTVLSVMATPVDSKKRDVDPRLKQAVADADGPASSLFFGELAFSRGDAITAVSAAQKTLASAPNLVGAIELLTRVALASGKFEPLEQAVGPLPSEVSRPVLAFIAYERGDVEKLASLARGLSDQDDPGGVVRTRLALLRGAAPVPVDAVERLRGADKVAGDLCAADAAIDAGDLTRAHVVVDKWTDSPPFPARALRRARLLRHEGKFTDAERMLEQAPSLASTQIERILVEAEIAQSRDHALSLIDDRIGAAGPFLEAYVLARKGERDRAERRLAAAKTPGPDAPLSLRVAAALAYAELGGADGGAAFVQVLAEKFPQNRDVKRAAAKLSPAEDPKPEPKRKRR